MAPRRSPKKADLQRDSARTRARLLGAALEEFAEKGFAGARVRDIADRAGVNQQLISYHFGGKAGLYEALQSQWDAQSATIDRPHIPMDEVVVGFLHASQANPAWARLMLWQNLSGGPTTQAATASTTAMVTDIRQRQAKGELDPSLDPASVALILFAAAAAPTMLPLIADAVRGNQMTAEEFSRTYADQLALLVRNLASPPALDQQPTTPARRGSRRAPVNRQRQPPGVTND